MKKIVQTVSIACILGAMLFMVSVKNARSQNLIQTFIAYMTGGPNFVANGGGTGYGQWCNATGSLSSWFFASSTSATNCGPAIAGFQQTPNAWTVNQNNVIAPANVGNTYGVPSTPATPASLAANGVFSSSSIPIGYPFEILVSSGGNLNMTATPTIATTTAPGGGTNLPYGTVIVFASSSTSAAPQITLYDNSVVSGSLLKIPTYAVLGSSVTIYGDKTATFIFSPSGYWNLLSYGNNQ